MIKVEIACNHFLSCQNAGQGGAHRIELFENLAEGGCTPSAGMIQKVNKLPIPIYVMIRPRGGNFSYTNDEVDIMLQDIAFCKATGVAGIVLGCLTSTGEVDKKINKKLLEAWSNGPATFHRAIDRTDDVMKASKIIVDLGFERILSSGGANGVMDGLEVLKKMQKMLGNEIVIMPGAGVTAGNAKYILETTGCSEIHTTCKNNVPSLSNNLNKNFHDEVSISDRLEIKKLMKNVKHL